MSRQKHTKESDIGATAVEYSILVSAIAAAIVMIATQVGGRTLQYFSDFWTLLIAH